MRAKRNWELWRVAAAARGGRRNSKTPSVSALRFAVLVLSGGAQQVSPVLLWARGLGRSGARMFVTSRCVSMCYFTHTFQL